jgi:hypothetical protein
VDRLVGEKYDLMVTTVKVVNSVRGLFNEQETQSDCAIIALD